MTTAVSGTPEPSAAPGVDLLMAETAKRPGWFMIWEPEVQILHSPLPDHENRKYEWYIRAAAGSGDAGVEADASYHRESLAQRIGL